MTRWLKVMRAEFVRDIQSALRYPVEVASGLVIMYALFFGLYTGARTMSGDFPLSSAGVDALIISFAMWFFALFALNAMSVDIESEARQGTLEQVFLSSPSFLGVIWVRGFVHLAAASAAVVVLLVLIQATTGNWLTIPAPTAFPALITVLLTVTAMLGFGLILGGLTLVFKRIGQFSAIVQFGLLFIALADPSQFAPPWNAVVFHIPLAGGISVLNLLLAHGDPGAAMAALPLLLADTAFYALLGSAVFLGCQRIALRNGTLGHY